MLRDFAHLAVPKTVPAQNHFAAHYSFRTSSGSLAIFAAIRLASSRVEQKRSQRRPSFFNARYSAARPMIALFFFESETAGLTFVRHCWPHGLRW
jgi:hypothetical protein